MALLETRRKSLQARGIEARKRLLASVRTLLATHEMDEIALADVASHAGVAKGSAYFFYADIEDLYVSLQAELKTELLVVMERPIRKRIRRWQEIIPALNERGMQFYCANPAARQLHVGPKTSPALKLRDRRSDVSIGRLYEERIAGLFVMPEPAANPQMFFRAVELADVMFCLSVLDHGTITKEMCAEADRAAVAYLETYLPAKLPRRRRS